MTPEQTKTINRCFHDIESRYFSQRHGERILRESLLYRGFFAELRRTVNGPLNVLDIASGTGLVEKALRDIPGLTLVCADISCGMLSAGRADCCRSLPRHYVCSDAEHLGFSSGSFQAITCNAAMHHFPSLEEFAKEALRVLSPKGYLLVGFEPNRRFWRNPALTLPYRCVEKIRSLYRKKEETPYGIICAQAKAELVRLGVLDKDFPASDLLQLVDVHTPNAGDHIDYGKGFDPDTLVRSVFRGFSARVRYHYHAWPKALAWYNRMLFPRDAAQFSLILQKP
jgi:ubiquinone/menaquinone biosynthesis C-methylase UbiE